MNMQKPSILESYSSLPMLFSHLKVGHSSGLALLEDMIAQKLSIFLPLTSVFFLNK